MSQMTVEQMEKRVAELDAELSELRQDLTPPLSVTGNQRIVKPVIEKQAEQIDLLSKLLVLANARIDELTDQIETADDVSWERGTYD